MVVVQPLRAQDTKPDADADKLLEAEAYRDKVHGFSLSYPKGFQVAKSNKEVADLENGVPGRSPAELDEDLAFLRWLSADHFVFLIEDGGLAGGDGSGRFVEVGDQLVG